MATTQFRSPGVDHLLPTSVVGSHPIPSWVWAAQAEIQLGHFGELDVKELWQDAAQVAILDQEQAGVDLITDGEISRTEFIGPLLGSLRNLEVASPALRQTGSRRMTCTYLPDHGKLSLDPATGFGILAEWEFARRVATHLLKVSVPGPYTLAAYILAGEGYASWTEIVWDLAAIVNGEARQLAAAGVPFIQIDEPLVIQEGDHGAYHGDTKLAVNVLNRTVAGVTARTGLHVCFGNNRRAPYGRRKYAGVYPALLGVEVNQFLHEYVNRGMDEIELWKDWGDPRELAVGVVDDKNYYIETPEEVADTIRLALRYVVPEKLWLTPDCGLRNQPRYIGLAKLYALTNGAEIVRAELEGRPPELRDGLRGGRLIEVAQRALDYLPAPRGFGQLRVSWSAITRGRSSRPRSGDSATPGRPRRCSKISGYTSPRVISSAISKVGSKIPIVGVGLTGVQTAVDVMNAEDNGDAALVVVKNTSGFLAGTGATALILASVAGGPATIAAVGVGALVTWGTGYAIGKIWGD